LKDAKVRVPEPIKFSQNMLVMEFIGEEGTPAPMLRNVELEDPSKTYKTVVKYVKLAYKKAGLVIGDLSEYNILMQRGEPVIIDVGQGMTTDHYNSKEFLVRDIKNINHFFRSYDVKIIENEVLLKQIMGVKK